MIAAIAREGAYNDKVVVSLCLCLFGQAPPRPSARPRDEAVIEAALLHYLQDQSKELWALGEGRSYVLLHHRNPEKIGILSADQIKADLRTRRVSHEVLQALRRRNDAGREFKSVPFSFRGYRLDRRIKVGDFRSVMGVHQWYEASRRGPLKSLVGQAKGCFELYAPGYSADGQSAVVRGWTGPSPHGATATYFLVRRGEKWQVQWREFAYYV